MGEPAAKEDPWLTARGRASPRRLPVRVTSRESWVNGLGPAAPSRLRIARAMMLNLIPVGVFWAIVARDEFASPAIAVLAALGSFAAGAAWVSIDDTYGQRLFQAYKLTRKSSGTPTGAG